MDRLMRDMPSAQRAGLRKGGHLYLHASRRPLEEVDLDQADQGDLWHGECEGMCGV